ncbi:MAG: glycosyltransferase family 9 protein [Bacteroidota bacterium]
MKVGVLLVRLHYFLLNAVLVLLRKLLFRKIKSDASNILIVRKGNLGDLICSFPAFEAIKSNFPHATIDILTTHGTQSDIGVTSVIPHGYFHQMYEYRSFTVRSLFALLKQNKYDTVIELPPDVDTFWNQVRNMVFFRLAGIKSGGGWTITRSGFLKKTQLRHVTFDTEQQRLQKILKSCGIDAGINQYPALFSSADLAVVRKKITIDTSGKLVAIAVGAKLDKKKWPLAYVKTVAQFLINNQYTLVAVGNVSDHAAVESLGIEAIQNTCGQLSIAESAALLSLCSFTICNDSGPMHVSYAVGTPVYAIFSARNYRGKWNPPADGKNSLFVNYQVPCAGCMNAPCSDNICMKQITPEQVIQSIALNLQE